MSTELAKIIADFQTSLATTIAIGGVSGTLVSNTDDDGVTLPNGRYFFTIDGGNAFKEHISCTLTGKEMTDIYSVSRQGVETSGAVKSHRVGATIIITDFAHIKKLNDLLDGTTDLDSDNPLKYDADPTITDDKELATKKYIDDVAIAGGANASSTVKGLSKLSEDPVSATEPIAVGDDDPRIPTTDEKAALAGTLGTPSATNKFVTEDGLSLKTSATNDISDGNVTISVNTTLTTDMYYDILTINAGIILTTNGYKIFANELINNGTIDFSGGAGGAGGNGQAVSDGQVGNYPDGFGGDGGAGASQLNTGSLFGSVKSGDGGKGSSNKVGTNGEAGENSNNCFKGNGASGGDGGLKTATYGAERTDAGAGGTGAVTVERLKNFPLLYLLFDYLGFFKTSAGNGGGGGGGCYYSGSGGSYYYAGGGGGGGGASGGTILISSKKITNNGYIYSKGGAGGAGGNGAVNGSYVYLSGSGGGGGGGGCGGLIVLIYEELVTQGTISVAGGSGGAGGIGGNNGNNGSSGTTGKIVLIDTKL